MSKTRKLFLVLLSLCLAVALGVSVGVVGFAADETPVTVSAVETVASEFTGNEFTMRVDLTTDAAGLPGGALTVNGTARYFRNGASAALGAAQSRNGSVVKLYFKDATGLAFTNGVSEVGDILVVDAGFSFSNTSGTAYKVEGNLSMNSTAPNGRNRPFRTRPSRALRALRLRQATAVIPSACT